jgi:hypothetical protein
MLSTVVGLALLSLLLPFGLAHGNHGQEQAPIVKDGEWAAYHMAGVSQSPTPPSLDTTLTPVRTPIPEEHHITDFDAASFFTLHDFDGRGSWSPDEILRMYGLEDESLKHITEDRKHEVVREVMRLCDANKNGVVERDEWIRYSEAGGKLPDFGV